MKLIILSTLFLTLLLSASFILTQVLASIAKNKLPATGKFTEVSGGIIHWTDEGDGEVIVLIHGLGGNHHNFSYMLSELSRKYRIVSIDRLGSAWSKRTDSSYANFTAQADAIVEFIDKEKLERPLLVGHSLGGAFSLGVGTRFPEKIRGLALICPASMNIDATPKVFSSLEIKNPTVRVFFSNVLFGPFILMKQKKFLAEIFKPEAITFGFDIKGGALLSRLPRQFQTTCEDLIAAKEAQDTIQLNLKNLDIPTYVLFAENDSILDPQYHGVAFSKMTGAKLEMVPKTGHMLPVTQPQICNKFVEDVMFDTGGL